MHTPTFYPRICNHFLIFNLSIRNTNSLSVHFTLPFQITIIHFFGNTVHIYSTEITDNKPLLIIVMIQEIKFWTISHEAGTSLS